MKTLLKKILPLSLRLKIIGFFDLVWASFCRLLPLKKTVLFYSIRADGRLLDNSKALYSALECDKRIFASLLPHTDKEKFKAIYLIMTSKVIVTDDYCKYMRVLKLRKKQKLIQIWHACGAFKKFGLDAPSCLTEEQEKLTHSQYSLVAVTGKNCIEPFASAFGVSTDRCVPVGLPRTDYIVNNSANLRIDFYEKHPDLSDKKIYLYCPTFREKDGKQKIYDPGIDWKSLDESLSNNELFVVCRHPIMSYDLINGNYRHIVDMTDESTLNLISVSSVVVTDYSSVIYDAVLLNVPILFYCPDIADYERGFYLDFPDDLPGSMITDGSCLYNSIKETADTNNVLRYENFRAGQLSACDGHSVERLKKITEDYLKS